jgi:hypothetical protein
VRETSTPHWVPTAFSLNSILFTLGKCVVATRARKFLHSDKMYTQLLKRLHMPLAYLDVNPRGLKGMRGLG